jgi:hypothetical protein
MKTISWIGLRQALPRLCSVSILSPCRASHLFGGVIFLQGVFLGRVFAELTLFRMILEQFK